MVVYLYRWRLKPGKEAQFQKAWTYVTEQLREKSGSLGSRLHFGSDGIWYGYAQWPSAELRDQSNLKHEEILEARKQMKDATLVAFDEIVLTPVSDYLIFPKS
jgi:hypothetical protein